MADGLSLPQIYHKATLPRRPAPFSIRLSAEERSRLEAEAQGMPLGGYIKAKALGAPPLKRMAVVEDRQALARALALLGQTHYANNLNQLAHLANMGALPLTPEVIEELEGTLRLIGEVRALIVRAMGVRKDA
ncbi:MAG: plasmid mobilization relaxosome protein MobC [Alphaproteobacteria bacterium]|nr:plasmid mobilization relaxosome protein MobC [Alphaproteobacteria bacterium]